MNETTLSQYPEVDSLFIALNFFLKLIRDFSSLNNEFHLGLD